MGWNDSGIVTVSESALNVFSRNDSTEAIAASAPAGMLPLTLNTMLRASVPPPAGPELTMTLLPS
jgi:hypothetical protein